MYDSSRLTEGSVKECKPDYEKVAIDQKAELVIIENFKKSLLEFIGVINRHSFKQKPSSIPELLGTVEIDIINRQKQYERTLEMIEKDS